MNSSVAGSAAVWSAAISASAVDPHAAPIALGAAVAREVFHLVHARVHRSSVLAYLRTAGAETYLHVGPSPVSPGLVLSNTWGFSRPGDEEEADPIPTNGDSPPSHASSNPGDFFIKQRSDWLAYAMTHARSWPDAEDAVSHVVQKILEHHSEYGTLCPEMRDPVGWSKKIIRNYLIDQYRRSTVQVKRASGFLMPEGDIADDITDQIIARKALAFVASLGRQEHMIAMMRWVDGLEPKEIADQLGLNARTVRTSLHRTRKKMRARLGIAEPHKILSEGTT